MGNNDWQNPEAINKKINDLEAQRASALTQLAQARGSARVRLRVHLTVLDRRLRFYRGYLGEHWASYRPGYHREQQRRDARNTQSLTEIHEVAAQGEPEALTPLQADERPADALSSPTQVDNTAVHNKAPAE